MARGKMTGPGIAGLVAGICLLALIVAWSAWHSHPSEPQMPAPTEASLPASADTTRHETTKKVRKKSSRKVKGLRTRQPVQPVSRQWLEDTVSRPTRHID